MKKILYLGAIPFIVTIFAVLFTNAAGPYWLSTNNDPAYFYFFNFLYVIDKLPLYPTTHPGLTLDVLGALTIKLFHPTLFHQDLFLKIIQNPEFYLHVIHYIMVFMYVVSLIILGWYAYKKSQDIIFVLLVQLSSLVVFSIPSVGSGYGILPVIAHVNPEILLLTAINLLMIGLLKIYWDKDTRSGVFLALYLGGVCALGVFTKYTFILSLALVLFLLRGWMSRCWFILSFMAIGFIFYNVETDPYHRILIWVKNLIFKSGYTGGLSEKFIDPAVYMSALVDLIRQSLLVFLTAAAAWIVSSIALLRKGKTREVVFLWLVSGFVLLQYLMVAKHPGLHYMIPAIGLCGLVLALLYHQFHKRVSPNIVGAVVVLFMTVKTGELIYYVQKLSEHNNAMTHYSQSLSAIYPGYAICPFYQSSSQLFVLACYTNDMNTYYNKLLKQLYPDYYYYDTNARDFKDFLSRWVPLSEIKAGHKGVLLYGGAAGENFFKPYTTVHEIEHTPQGEALYEVIAQQSPHAGEYMQYSVMLFAQGQNKQALEYAVYAKQLGFPDDITGYLNQIVARIKNGAN